MHIPFAANGRVKAIVDPFEKKMSFVLQLPKVEYFQPCAMAQATAVSPSSLPFLLPSLSSRNTTLEVQTHFSILLGLYQKC
jgi:hypothetical protein